uniref:ATP synthase complex subunit 8 n=1 Tax=Ceracris nigricornis nigricornis TaxID=215037 RepID=A0A7L9QCZ4_9ORTH|nr:ATP synthase F0 subunit 8 [Ceracris nigricornis nigricornis]UXR11483.1 ATP synthase F0 subunit 8 [Ceracris nigricornis nigricornis]
MPQMSPLMWFSLFIMFSITLILFNQMSFFSYKICMNKMNDKKMIKSKNPNWKW